MSDLLSTMLSCSFIYNKCSSMPNVRVTYFNVYSLLFSVDSIANR